MSANSKAIECSAGFITNLVKYSIASIDGGKLCQLTVMHYTVELFLMPIIVKRSMANGQSKLL